MDNTNSSPFTGYQKLIIFLLAMTQFTVVLDFMIMSPLGDLLMKSLKLTPTMFGVAVSAYAFSAGFSGLLTAGFADKYDRKHLLLFFYTGFITGTIACGLAHSYTFLLIARIVTGLFGGVIGSISMAIVTDLFAFQQRGRVMGFLQMGFGASQVLGVPISLWLANFWGWEAPFILTAGIAIIVGLVILSKMQPVREHLALQRNVNAFAHLWSTITNPDYRIGYSATAVLTLGGFMLMPFGSAFAVNNLGVTPARLPVLFMVSGLCSLLIMPTIGKLSDKVSKFKIFTVASIWMMIVCVLYTNQSFIPFWQVVIFNIVLMMGIMGRMIPSSALTSSVPETADRGAFMSINSSLQQIAGGAAAALSGMIVVQQNNFSPLEHYNTVGYFIVGISLLGIFLTWRVSNMIGRKRPTVSSADQDQIIAEAI